MAVYLHFGDEHEMSERMVKLLNDSFSSAIGIITRNEIINGDIEGCVVHRFFRCSTDHDDFIEIEYEDQDNVHGMVQLHYWVEMK